MSKYYHEVEKKLCVVLFWMKANVWTEEKQRKFVPFGRKLIICPEHTVLQFSRGETQSLTSVTLGTKQDEKLIDEALTQGKERFCYIIIFPPYSTGEARASRGIGRRNRSW